MKTFLVIPTIRSLNFLKVWGKEFINCNLVIVEDSPTKKIKIPHKKFASIHHFSWEDIDQEFGQKSWIFSRHNSGIRAYGFWKAYKAGADVVITLDDDCYPVGKDFVKKHLENLKFKAPVDWINTYPDPKWMFTRGFPYKVRSKREIIISHGLWSGALDLDAKSEVKLKSLLSEKPYPPIRQVIPENYFYPMCSMNLAFVRKAIPFMFFPMMGLNNKLKNWDFDRFDDIWAGIFSKKIIDHLGWGVVSGSPMVNHKKASLPKGNLVKEKNGMNINEIMWERVNAVRLTKTSPKECYIELAKKVKFPGGGYFKKLKEAMIIWANLF